MDTSTGIIVKNKMDGTEKLLVFLLGAVIIVGTIAITSQFSEIKAKEKYATPIKGVYLKWMLNMCEKHEGLVHIVRHEHNVFDVRCGDTAVFQLVKFTKIEDAPMPTPHVPQVKLKDM